MIGYYDLSLSKYIYIFDIETIYHVYVQFLYPAAILLGFIVVEIVFGLYFTIELYCRTLASNDLQMDARNVRYNNWIG